MLRASRFATHLLNPRAVFHKEMKTLESDFRYFSPWLPIKINVAAIGPTNYFTWEATSSQKSHTKPQPSLLHFLLFTNFHYFSFSQFFPSSAHDNSTPTDHFPAAASFLYSFPCRCGEPGSCAVFARKIFFFAGKKYFKMESLRFWAFLETKKFS